MKRTHLLHLFVCVIVASLPAMAFGTSGDRPTVTIMALSQSEEGFTPIQKRVLHAFREEVQLQKLDQPGGRSVTLFVDGIETSHEGEPRIVVSVMVLAELPEAVVQLAADAEAFYRVGTFEDQPLPEEGAHIRRSISEDWIREYRAIQDHFLFVISEAELDEKARSLVASL